LYCTFASLGGIPACDVQQFHALSPAINESRILERAVC
jgi:hypothetical protein